MLGYFTLVSLLFSVISISISNIIFTLVSVVFLNPYMAMDFDSAFKFIQFDGMQVHVCVSRMEVSNNVHGEDKYFTVGQVSLLTFINLY